MSDNTTNTNSAPVDPAVAAITQFFANAMQTNKYQNVDTKIKHEGSQIVLPENPSPMTYDEAISTIKRIKMAEDKIYRVHEHIAGAPWDTLVSLHRTLEEAYGVVLMNDRQSFFGPIPPSFQSINISPSETIQVPLGEMQLPGIEAPITVQIDGSGTHIFAQVKEKDRTLLRIIAEKAREHVRTASIYRGKAIQLNVDEDGDLVMHQQPVFLDLSNVKETDIIHTRDTEALIRNNIFAPLKHTDACRANKIPLKRGILLEGKYGTGKTLTARVSAKVATDNGWTFIMLNRSQGLADALAFAKNYQPCVIFAEDIDRAADRDNEDVNDLVNLLDGLDTKSSEIMCVLTTNFLENIDRALLRPGRFDAVIKIGEPDAETAQRIFRAYAGELLEGSEDLAEAGVAAAGMIPASLREVVERAKLSMLMESREKLTAHDLYVSATGMQQHMALLTPPEVIASPEARLGAALVEILDVKAIKESLEKTYELSEEIRKLV